MAKKKTEKVYVRDAYLDALDERRAKQFNKVVHKPEKVEEATDSKVEDK